jgi:lytic murein transglycosylase
MSRLSGAIITVALVLLVGPTAAAAAGTDRAAVERGFQAWIKNDLWPEARAAGVARATYEAAFKSVTLDWDLPELVPPGTATPPNVEHQAEFRSPAAYFHEGRIATLARSGQARHGKWEKSLAAVEKRYGVPRGIVVSVWGRESGFGEVRLPHLAVRVLATGAFMGRRKELFRSELIAALQILEAGEVTPGRMRSSWAGALGQPQLLPSHFLRYAVDFDGDGRRDIWNSVPDALASIANSLRQQGWNPERSWGVEVHVPQSVPCSLEGPEQGKPMAEWAALGVTRIGGEPLPGLSRNRTAFLLMPAGRFGPAFIVTENFYTLKSYNNSDLYALYVAHVADRFSGARRFAAAWRDIGHFTRGDVARMQRELVAEGYDVGAVDGLIGFKTRIAVGKWQARTGREVTCYPDPRTVKSIH